MAQHKIAILLHDEFEMWRPPPWFIEKLRADFPEIEVCNSRTKRDDEQALRNADVMIGWSLPPEQLHAAKVCDGFIPSPPLSISFSILN